MGGVLAVRPSGAACICSFICFLPFLLGCEAEQRSYPTTASRRVAMLRRWNGSEKSSTTKPASQVLTLDKAIAEALSASPELEQIQQRIEASAAQVRQAQATFYPRLILSESYSATDNPVYALMYIINQKRANPNMNFNSPGQKQNNAMRVEGQWLLLDGGTRLYNTRAARQGRVSEEADLLAARNKLTGAVCETYYRWLQAMDFVAVAERAVKVAQANEDLAEQRREFQMALRSEVLRLKTNRAEAEGNLVAARGSANKTQAALERLLVRRIHAGEIPEAVPPPTSPQLPKEDSYALSEEALNKRAEMAAVDALISAAQARVKAAQGALVPQVSANAHYEWNSRDLTDARESWMAGVQASWNIFEGGLTLARVREAQARVQEATKRGQQIALDIALEVHQAVAGMEDAIAKIKVGAEQKRWAEQGLEDTQELYRNQLVTVDALLQAELAWNRAEVTYSSAAFEGQIARAVLRRALGDFADGVGGAP